MAIDKTIPTSPPANTTMQYFAQQVQEELGQNWEYTPTKLSVFGGPNALSATAIPAPTAYVDGQNYVMFVPAANTAGVTLSISGLAAMPILKSNTTAFAAGELTAGQVLFITYSSAHNAFVAIGGQGGGGTTLPSPTQQHQILKADALLSIHWSQEIFCGNF